MRNWLWLLALLGSFLVSSSIAQEQIDKRDPSKSGLVSPTRLGLGQTIDLTQGERHQVQLDDRKRLSLEKTLAGYKDRGEFLARPMDLGEARSIRVDWIEQWTAPQTWKKHPGN